MAFFVRLEYLNNIKAISLTDKHEFTAPTARRNYSLDRGVPIEKTVKYLIILTSILFFGCANNATDTITLIPDGYTGPVKISLCDGKGKDEKLENGKRVYEIDTNGLLTTKFKAEFGWQFNEYYYVNNKDRQEIRFINSYDKDLELDKDSVYVFGEKHSGIGFMTDSTGSHKTCPTITFYVGKYENIEKKMHEIIMFSFKSTELIEGK